MNLIPTNFLIIIADIIKSKTKHNDIFDKGYLDDQTIVEKSCKLSEYRFKIYISKLKKRVLSSSSNIYPSELIKEQDFP